MPRPRLFFGLALLAICPIQLQAQSAPDTSRTLQSIERRQLDAVLAWETRTTSPRRVQFMDERVAEVVDVVNGLPVYYTTQNHTAGLLVGSTPLHEGSSSGFELSGNGVSVGIWDAGAVYVDHQELKIRSALADMSDFSNHATHVAGTLIAGGVHPNALGMAPRARLTSYNWNFHASEMQVEARDGLLVSNHSYGKISGWHLFPVLPDSSMWYWFGDPSISEFEDYTFGYYDYTASLFDDIVFDFPYFLPVIAAGNEGDDTGPESGPYMALDTEGRWQPQDAGERPIPPDGGEEAFDTIPSFALAKNVLTVGSIEFRDGASSPILSPFSSRGPTDDGRIKPDLVAPGKNLFSPTAAGASEYAVYSGTSMATPVVAGSLLLLQQLAKNQRKEPLKAATLKGLVLHTARDLGVSGPDFRHGWGLIDVTAAAHMLKKSFRTPSTVQESTLAPGDTLIRDLFSAGGPVKITLSWTDPAGPVSRPPESAVLNNRTPRLVNDLDIRLVEIATGLIHMPYALSVERPAAPAQPGDNVLDPIEQIYISQAPAGLYSLRITHKDALAKGHAQPFSLLMSGIQEMSSPVALDTAFAVAEIGDIKLVWETFYESNAGTFDIERASLSQDATGAPLSIAYLPLTTLISAGTPNRRQAYEYSDPVYLQGVYRYRILYNDTETGARILIAEFDARVAAPDKLSIRSVYPNPFALQSRLVLDVPETMETTFSIHDILGRTIALHTQSTLPAGRHIFQIHATGWAPGIYFARITAGQQQLLHRLVVVR